MSRSPSSSSYPFPTCSPSRRRTYQMPDLKLDIARCSGWSFSELQFDKRMSGKGFIEPHRNNLPRRKRKVMTTAKDGAAIALEIDKTVSQILLPTSKAGPRSSIEKSNLCDGTSPTSTDHTMFGFTATSICPPTIQTQIHHASSSVDTNITEPPSSLCASPTPSALLDKSPALSNSSTIFLSHPTFQTPKRSLFHGYHLDGAVPRSPPPITPSKGHLQPMSATLPRRHRLSVAREQERRRKSIAEQQRQSICAQELSKGITLGFLAEGDDHDENIVRIKVYDDSIAPLASPPSPPFPAAPASTSPSILSPEPHLQLTLPSDSSSYTDGTTSLTDSQIQQACTFIDEHISIPLADTSSINSTLRPGHVSVLILTPCTRPEEAMSIGISYLAGIEDTGKVVQEMKGDKTELPSDDDDDDDFNDYTYSTVHRLLMAFHDDPGIPIPNCGLKPEVKELEAPLGNHRLDTSEEPTTSTFCNSGCGIVPGSLRGLRPEWRGVLSFDGMQRLDKVWTCISRRS